MSDNQDDVIEALLEWRVEGKIAVLATVVRTWGSSPRPVGSHLGVTQSGHFVGSVSGGCIEGAVIEAAMDVMANNKPQLLDFEVSDAMAWSFGLACGGRLQVLVERIV